METTFEGIWMNDIFEYSLDVSFVSHLFFMLFESLYTTTNLLNWNLQVTTILFILFEQFFQAYDNNLNNSK